MLSCRTEYNVFVPTADSLWCKTKCSYALRGEYFPQNTSNHLCVRLSDGFTSIGTNLLPHDGRKSIT